MKSAGSWRVWALIAIGEFAIIFVCLRMMPGDRFTAVGVNEVIPNDRPKREGGRQEALRGSGVATGVSGDGKDGGGPEAGAGDGGEEFDTLSYSGLMNRLKAETDPKRKARLLGVLVNSYGTEFSNEIWQYLMAYRPEGDARIPLLHLAGDNVRNNEKIFRKVLQDMAPGQHRNSLLYTAVTQLAPDRFMDLLESLKTTGFKEDEDRIAYLISDGSFGRAEVTEAMLVEMMGEVESRKIGESLANEMIRRKVNGLLESGGSEKIQDITTLVSGVPESYRDYFAKTYYERVMPLAIEQKYEFADVIAKGVPAATLAPFAGKLASARGSLTDPMDVIQSCRMPAEARTVYLRAVVSNWLKSDSVGVGRAVDELPPGGDRDLMISELVRYHGENDELAVALKWTSEISDQTLGDELRAKVKGDMEKK